MKRSDYMLAALASAVLPNLGVAGVRENVQASATDEAKGIDQTVIQDASGKLYDVYATNTKEGRTRLIRRVKAAQTLAAAREPGGLGFDMDRVVAFAPGDVSRPGQTATAQAVGQQTQAESTPLTPRKPGPTGETTVMIAVHRDGQARPLDLLTLDDCAAVGTAIGAIHRLPSTFLANAKYPVVTTGQIRSQLTAWIRRLRSAGHVPQEITDSWARIMDTEGLWSFSTCTVHGGFSDGDFLFSGSTITTVTNWQDMQVNDPARDLAWIFGKLDESHRNAVLSAYGRMMGSRLDDLIMLRANLWLQMEQVGEFIQALNRADNDHIMQFKAQVERLAHQLGVIKHTPAPAQPQGRPPPRQRSPVCLPQSPSAHCCRTTVIRHPHNRSSPTPVPRRPRSRTTRPIPIAPVPLTSWPLATWILPRKSNPMLTGPPITRKRMSPASQPVRDRPNRSPHMALPILR